MDALEPRTLMAVLPPPTILTRTDVSNTPGSTDTAPSISVDPLDANRAVAVWSRRQNLTNPDIPEQYGSLGQGAFTIDGGQTWTLLTADTYINPASALNGFKYSLPSPLPDPANGPPDITTQYTLTTDLTVAFDRQHNVYVLESLHDAKFVTGALVLQKYNFAGASPNLTVANKIVHQWFDSDTAGGTPGQGDQAHTPTMVIDTGVGNPNTSQPDGSPAGIITGPDGNIYVAITDINEVQQLNGGSGLYQSTFVSGIGLYRPLDIAYNPQDNTLFISNEQNAQVLRVKADTGESLGIFTQTLVSPKAPRDAVISPIDGNLYVSSRDTSSILRYNAKTGAFMGSFVAPHAGNLVAPEGIAFGSDDRLYVADSKTNTILRYDGKTGVFIDTFVTVANNGGLDGPRGLIFGPDKNIYVSSFNTGEVLRYDRNLGTFLGVFATASTIDNDLNQPTSLAFSPIDGHLYVANYRGITRTVDGKPFTPVDEVLRYNGATGAFISSFLAPPTEGLSGPVGLHFRLNGPLGGKDELLVGSFDTGEVYRFNARTGVFLDKFVPDNSGALDGPTGFVFEDHGTTDPTDDTFYVTSGNTDTILRYRATDGTFLESITPEPLNAPRATTLGPDGYLYAVARDTDSVVRYDATTGKLLGTFVKSGSGGLNLPGGLAFGTDLTGDAYPDLFVGGNFYNNILVYHGKTGAFHGVFLTGNPNVDGLDDPEGLTFKDGKLYVTSAQTGQVLQYDGTTGAFLKTYTPDPLLAPEGTVVSNGKLYVASRDSDQVMQYDDATGVFIKVFVARNSGGLDAPRGLTFRSGELFVSSYNTDKVLRYDANGNFLDAFTPDPLKNPEAATVGPDGHLYVTTRDFASKAGTVAARDLNQVLRYDGTTGAFIDAFVSASANGGLLNPAGLAFGLDLTSDGTADLLVSSRGTDQVLAYDGKTGAFLMVFAGQGLGSPAAIVLGPDTDPGAGVDRDIFVANQDTDEILRFDGASGAPVGTGGIFVVANPQRLNGPGGLTFGPDGDLFVSSQFTNTVVRYAGPTKGTAGQFVSTFVAAALGGLANPTGLIFGADQDLYVSSFDSDSILRYSGTNGSFLNRFVHGGSGGLDGPTGLIFGADANLFVVSRNSQRVLRFDAAVGRTLGNFVAPGDNGMTDTRGGVIGPDGHLYVVSATDSSIKRYHGSTSAFINNFVTPGLGGLTNPVDLVFSADGNNLYVTGAGGQIYRYNGATGALVSLFVNDATKNFRGIAFARPAGFPTGLLYVADAITKAVLTYDAVTGAAVGTGGNFIAPGVGGLNTPERVAFGPDGNLYVTDIGTNTIRRYNGATGASLPAPGNTAALFALVPEGPRGLTFGPDGNLLITSASATRTLMLYNGVTGLFIRVVGSSAGGQVTAGSIVPLFNRDGNILVTSGAGGGVKRLGGGNGAFLGDFTPPTLDGPTGLSFGPDGNLYVASSLTARIAKYDGTNGGYLGDVNPAPLRAPQDAILNPLPVFSTTNITLPGGTIVPAGSPIAAGTFLYAVSRTTNEVIRYFASTGEFESVFVKRGAGGLSQPKGLAINPYDGNIYVASQGTGQILRFDSVTGLFSGVAVDTHATLGVMLPDSIVFGFDGNADTVLDLYASDITTNRIIRVDGRTQAPLPIGTFPNTNTFTAAINNLAGLAFGPDGRLYAATANTVTVITQGTGVVAGVFVTAGLGGLLVAQRLAFPGDGFLYVTDSAGNKVVRYQSADGKFVDTGPFIPAGLGGLTTPIGIVFTPAGVLVASSGTDAILRYTAGIVPATALGPFTSRTLVQPEDLVFLPASLDAQQRLLVSSYGTDEILRYTYAGNGGQFNGIFVTAGSGGLSGPQAMIVGADELLYVSSSKTNSVLRYRGKSDPFGTFLAGDFFDTFVLDSSGGLSTPQGLAFAGDGTLLVASRRRDVPPELPLDPLQAAAAKVNVVLRYGPTGASLGSFTPPPLENPVGLGFNPGGDGALYVTSRNSDEVMRFVGNGVKGDFLGVFTSHDLDAPTGATIGPDNNLYVASRNSNEILRYDGKTGAFSDVFVTRGSGGLLRPEAIAFSPRDGNLYVASKGARPAGPGTVTYSVNILRFKGSTGESLGTFASFDLGTQAVTAAPIIAYNPVGMAFDSDGNVYVSNFNTNQVFRFRAVSGAAFPAAGQTGAIFVNTTATGSTTSLNGPVGLTFDKDPITQLTRDLFVSNSGSNQILRFFGTSGLPKPSTPNPGTSVFAATGTSGLTAPQFIAFDDDGTLYATSALGVDDPNEPTPAPFNRRIWTRNEVIRFNGGTGAFIDKFVTDTRGGLTQPTGLVFGRDLNGDGTKELLVASAITDQMLAYDGKTGSSLIYDGSKVGFSAKFQGPFTPGPLRQPEALAFGPGGDVFVSSGGTNSVLRYQAGTGKLQANYVGAGSGDLRGPSGLAFAADGSLLVASRDSDDILRYAPTSGFLATSLEPDRPIKPAFSFLNRFDPVTNPLGDNLLYVSSTDTDSVVRYDPATGKLLGTFVAPGLGLLAQPQGLAFGTDGNLYVASRDPVLDTSGNPIPGQFKASDKVVRFNGKTGQFLDTFVPSTPALLVQATGLVFGPGANGPGTGDLYVASYGNDKVLRFSSATGNYLADYVAGASGGLDGPSSLAFDAAGFLYVGSTLGNVTAPTGQNKPDSVLRYAVGSGNFDRVFVAPGAGGLDGPTALAFGPNGDLFVASDSVRFALVPTQNILSTDSSQDNRILRYQAGTGNFLGEYITRGSGELDGPSGLSFAADGSLLVVSRNNSLVIKYDATGKYVSRLDAVPVLRGVATNADVNGDGIFELYATAKDRDAVLVYDGKTGEYVRTFVESRAGGLSSPNDLIFDGPSSLYVSSAGTNSVIRYDIITPDPSNPEVRNTRFLRTYSGGGLLSPDGMIIRDGKLYVAGTVSNSVVVFNVATGAVFQILTGANLQQPKAVAFDSAGNLLVTSFGNKTVLRYDTFSSSFVPFEHAALPGFTDPVSNKIQNDQFSNNIYIAWATNSPADLQTFEAENQNAIVMTASSDGGKSFSPHQVLNDTRYLSTAESNGSPRLTVSQGRLPGTLSPSDPGVPAGQVTVVWDDFGTNNFTRTGLPELSDAVVSDRVQAGVSYSTGIDYEFGDPAAFFPASDLTPLTTTFDLPVNISDPRFTTVSHVDLRLSLVYPDLTLLQITLIAPNGTRVPLITGATIGEGLGLQPIDPTVSDAEFRIETIFDDQAPRAIDNALYVAPFVGHYRPETPAVNRDGKSVAGPGLSALFGMNRATVNGVWKLEITDNSGLGGDAVPPTFLEQRVMDWGLDFSSSLTDSKDVVIEAASIAVGRLERYNVKGIPNSGPLLLSNSTAPPALPGDPYFGGDPAGIFVAPVLASDNTLGSFSPNQGRIYVAYVDGYKKANFIANQPFDNTDIYLKFSDDGGLTWTTEAKIVNDDNGRKDGFSEADISGPVGSVVDSGRPQFSPSIAVDPSTGTLAISFYDTRHDPQHSRTAMYVGTSIDGGTTFAPQTFMNTPLAVTDGITGKTVILGPIPDNQSKSVPASPGIRNGTIDNKSPGYGQSQGLAFVNGKLYPAWASNENRGPSGLDDLDIRIVAATVASGPRVVSSTMGAITATTVTDINGAPHTFNDKRAGVGGQPSIPGVAEGTALADGFVIEFDRPVDPATLNPVIPPAQPLITVTFRDENTTGFAAGVNVPVNSVITPLLSGSTVHGPTKFLVRFTPQGGTGTYSYQVGPAIRDRIRTVSDTGVITTGNLMDQDGNAIGGQDPRTTPIIGLLPGDRYAVPTPSPISPTTYSGSVVPPPYDRTTQPLIVPGPHIVSTSMVGAVKTPDNLVTDTKVSGIVVTFDREMDVLSLNGASILRMVGPQGEIGGPFTVTPVPGALTDASKFLIGFPAQELTGTYVITMASTVQSKIGERLDTNQNAGLDNLRGDPTAGTEVVTFSTNVTQTIGGSIPGRISRSIINVPDQFTVQNVTLSIDITYPFVPDLDGFLIAPDGTRVQLFSNVGQTGDNKNFTSTTFDDTATTPIQNGGPPFFGTFNPRFPLSQFIGHTSRLSNGNGDWVLEIVDNVSGRTGTINSWSLNLKKPIPATGLGDPVADQVSVSFRLFNAKPDNTLASNTWTQVGPAGIGAKGPGLNAEISGRVTSTAIDPSDPSGNTVYVTSAGGGIWKTTNFLTLDPAGPTYVPLTDFGPTFGLNVGSIAVFGRNNDPNQSIIFAVTGDPDAIGLQTNFPVNSPVPQRGDSQSLTTRGVGFLRSTDGGATWILLDSTSNFDATGALLPLNSASRNHAFVNTVGFKVVVDPEPTPTGDVIVYAALSDVDANGNGVDGAGTNGGFWRSVDTGRTWTKMRAGQATDVILDLNSGTGAPDGNLQILYAAFRGDGVYRSPNRGQEFDLMAGTTGNPLIQSFDIFPTQPVGVAAPTSQIFAGAGSPNSTTAIKGRIVLARPSLTGKPLEDVLYQGWLYAAVISTKSLVTVDKQIVQGGYLDGLYVTKDFGQNWTRVQLPGGFTGDGQLLPSDDDRLGEYDPFGLYTPGLPLTFPPVPPRNNFNFGTGNFNLSLAVDPTNPNVVYLGGSGKFQQSSLLRVDTTGLADPHAFYMSQNDPEGKTKTIANYGLDGERGIMVGWNPALTQITEFHGPVVQSNPGAPYTGGPNDPFQPSFTPYLNLIANPRNPFLTGSTIPVTNTAGFINSGAKAKWTAFDQALKPDTFNNNPNDSWSVPVQGVHNILSVVDPATGKTRLIFGTDNGIFTAVDNGKGTLIGSLGSVQTLDGVQGDVKIATGSRNGNLQTAQLYYGAAQPSTGAAQASLLKGMFYASTQSSGSPYSDTNVINPGQVGYGDITWERRYIERSTGAGIGVVQTNSSFPDYGSFYRYILPSEMDNLTGVIPSVAADFLQRDLASRTFNLLQKVDGQLNPIAGVRVPDVPDSQWPFRKGYNFAINPLSGEQLIISSEEGRVFSTENQGKFWNVIGNPTALDSTNAQALAYGAPDVVGPDLGNLNSFVYAGTVAGRIFVTFNGGGGNGNQWINVSAGLDGSAIQQIITNPTRTSHEAYAVTRQGVYHMVDSKALNATWVNITGNLFTLNTTVFDNPTQVQARVRNLTSIQADWRYIIPDDFANPTGPTHPMLYVGGEGGVFRSIDGGGSWTFFPTISPNGVDATPASVGDGGGLPNAVVTDLDIALGEIDPTNGRPNVSTGPNVLLASTFGRGSFTIRLAPIVFPNSGANQNVLRLSTTLPAPGGSDTGLSNSDQITNLTQPVIEGLSQQSAFGSVVTVNFYEMTGGTKSPTPIGTGQTDAAGRFAVQIFPGIYTAGGTFDAFAPGFVNLRTIGIQATDQSLTVGNLTTFSFTIDVIAPTQPDVPTLSPASDTGRFNNDNYTSVTNPFIVVSGIESTARVALFRDGGAKAVGTRIGSGNIQDPGPLTDGVHTYYVVQEDVAGNFSPRSDNPPGTLLTITVDTVIPLPPLAPDLQTASDSGSSNTDNITNVTNPFLDVFASAGESKATLRLLRKRAADPPALYTLVGQSIGTGVVQDNTSKADGIYNYAVQQVDLAGNTGPIGTALTVTVDTQGNGPPTVPDLQAASDTGPSNTDNNTAALAPVFDVTSTDSGATVQLLRKLASDPVGAYTVVATAVALPGLLVAIADNKVALPNGTYSYAAMQVDVAGNPGPRSNGLTVVIDRTAAIDPIALVLDSKSDTGSSKSDQVTKDRAPFFDVTTGEPNQRIQLFRKVRNTPDSTYLAVGSPITVGAQGVGILQDPLAPPDGDFTYSVQATDLAGNPGSLGLVFTHVTFDNTLPTAPPTPDLRASSDTGTSQTDNITNSKAPSFDIISTLANPIEAGATIRLYRKLKPNSVGSYVEVGSVFVTDPTVAQVTDNKNPVDGLYTYAVRQEDLAGNVGPIGDPTPGPLEVQIDTSAPAVPTLLLDPRDDTGILGDGITSNIRPRLTGKTEALAGIVLFGDASATGQADSSGNYLIQPNTDLTLDQVYRVQVAASDIAGNTSTSLALLLTIDTTAPGTPAAPDLDPASDTGQFNDDNVTNIKTPFFNVSATESNATVQLHRKKVADPDTSYVLVGQVIGGGKIQDLGAANETDGTYTYATKQVDASGNVGSFGGTLDVVFDLVKPAPPPAPQLDASSDSGKAGDNITNVKIGRLFNLQATEPSALVQLFRRLQSAPDTTYVLVGSVVGSGQVTDNVSLPDTNYVYAAGQVDLAGNVGILGTTLAITVDSRAPNTPTLNLMSADDTGSKGDGVTSNKRPRFSGVTEAKATVELLSSGEVIAVTTADPVTGVYTLQPTVEQFDGTYAIQTRATDIAGNTATSLTTINLTIDTIAPFPVPSIGLLPADDTGLVGDGVTSVRRPHIVGTTEAKASVALLDDKGAVKATAVADSKGAYSLQPPLELDLGKFTYQARATDQAGNTSFSSTITITIVTTAPTSSTMTLVAADDSGKIGDGITNNNRPRFNGVAGPNLTVELIDAANNVFATTTSNTSGAYQLRPTVALANAQFAFRAQIHDGAGGTTFSNVVNVTIDTKAPAPLAVTILPADNTGVVGDFITASRQPRLVGKAEPNGVAALYNSAGTLLSAVPIAADGSLMLQSATNLKVGQNNLVMRTSDAAGNVSPNSGVSITVIKVPGDYDGDGRSDIAIYDAASATFFITFSNGGANTVTFGVNNNRGLPAAGDFDGDGRTDIAVYDPASATYFVTYSSGGSRTFPFGSPNHNNVPDVGDFDGDGRTDLAVFDQVDAKFFVLFSSTGILVQSTLGPNNGVSLPVPADYDGDGRTDLAVIDPIASAFTVAPANGGARYVKQFGIPNANNLPIPGDFDGDGRSDFAVYTPGNATFYQLYSNPVFNGGSKTFTSGVPNGRGIPVYADYDGDARTDTAVYDGAAAQFYITQSAGGSETGQFGNPSNRNVPIPSVVSAPSSVGTASVVGGPTDFTPIEPPATVSGRTALGFALGHSNRVAKATVPAKKKTKPKVVNHSRHQVVKVKALKRTPHDAALENLWGRHGE